MTTTASSSYSIGQTELARLANVSQKTVSRALGGVAGVNEETRQRIQQLAARHQYRPNAAARSTRSGSFGTVALLLGTHDGRSNLPAGLLSGIQAALGQHELNLMVVSLDDEQLTDTARVPNILREAHSDGLLIDYTHGFPPRMEQLISEFGIPAIWINTKRPHNAVYPDDYQAGLFATQHLVKLGHRRIAYADFTHGPDYPAPHYSVSDRREGYTHAMTAAGLIPQLIGTTQGTHVPREERVPFARRVLAAADRPTAMLAYSESTTTPFFLAAASQGLSIPENLSVVMFGDDPPRALGAVVTTMRVPQQEVGRKAAAFLQQRLSRRRDLPAIAVPFELEPGQTVMSLSRGV